MATKGTVGETLLLHTASAAHCLYASPTLLVTYAEDAFVHLLRCDPHGGLPDPGSVTDVEAATAIYTVAVHGNALAVGDDDSVVNAYDLPHGDFRAVIVRGSALPVRSIDYASDGRRLAVASDDLTLKLVDPSGRDQLVSFPNFVNAAPIFIKFHPRLPILAVLISNGSIGVFDLANDSLKLLKMLPIVPTVEPESHLNIDWRPDGELLAVPGTKDVKIINTDTWKTEFTLLHDHDTVVVAWQKSGMFLAAADKSNAVYVWNLESKQTVAKVTMNSEVASLVWHPTQNLLTIGDNEGGVTSWSNIIDNFESIQPKVTSTESIVKPNKSKSSAFFREKADVDKDAESLGGHPISDLGDDTDVDMNDDDDLGSFIDDDNGEYAHERERELKRKTMTSSLAFGAALPKQDPAFQPNSTVAKLNRRYLVFNMVGTIVSIDQQTHRSVDIEFHDASLSRPIHFKDLYDFSMATMNEHGALFACESSKATSDTDNVPKPSILYYKPFTAWDNNGQWYAYLSEGVAIGNKWAAAATDAGYIRLFSSAGAQLHVLSVGNGPVLTMNSSDDYLIMVHYADSISASGLTMSIYDVDKRRMLVQNTHLPLTPGSKLEWIGLSELGIPCTYDSQGVLRGCFKHESFTWAPLLDTRPLRKNRQDYYWPVGVLNDTFMMIICKGGDRQPYFPKPIISDVKIQMPLTNTDHVQLEEALCRERLFHGYNVVDALEKGEEDDRIQEFLKHCASMDKSTLKLVAQCCKDNRPMRALDYCTMLHLEKSLQVAYQLASRHHLVQLAERIDLIRQDKVNMSDPIANYRQTTAKSVRYIERPAPKEDILPPGISDTSFSRKLQTPRRSAPIINHENSHEIVHVADEDKEPVSDAPASVTPAPPTRRPNPFIKTVVAASPVPTNAFEAVHKHNEKKTKSTTESASTCASKKRKVTQSTLSFFKPTNTLEGVKDAGKAVEKRQKVNDEESQEDPISINVPEATETQDSNHSVTASVPQSPEKENTLTDNIEAPRPAVSVLDKFKFVSPTEMEQEETVDGEMTLDVESTQMID